MARSTWVAHAFEWEKLLKCHLKGKASKKLANGQNIDYSEKRKRPKGFICPCTGVKYHNIQTCLLVYAADSGERLQDHWSSGLLNQQLDLNVMKQSALYCELYHEKHVFAHRSISKVQLVTVSLFSLKYIYTGTLGCMTFLQNLFAFGLNLQISRISVHPVRPQCENCHKVANEPRREKTGLWCIRPGSTQTGLFKHRR